MVSLVEKFKLIRSAENLSRGKISEMIDVPANTIKMMEQRGSTPSGNILTKLCEEFPEYALWLMIDEINIEIGQIEPIMKYQWRMYRLFRSHTQGLKEYPNDPHTDTTKFDRNNKQHLQEMLDAQAIKNIMDSPRLT